MRSRRGPKRSIRRTILIAAVVLLAVRLAHAGDPQSYAVTIAATDQRDLDAALKAASQLDSLQPAGPIAPFALIGRAQNDVERLETVLQGFGYYQGKITITIDGRPLDDPGLSEAIESLPADKSASVAVVAELGPLYHLRKIAIEGELPETAFARLGLKSGDPAVAANVLEAQK